LIFSANPWPFFYKKLYSRQKQEVSVIKSSPPKGVKPKMRQRKLSGVNWQGALKQNGFKYGRKTRAGCICHSSPAEIMDDDDDTNNNNNKTLSRPCICHSICTSPGT
jgi:hypothetical protein